MQASNTSYTPNWLERIKIELKAELRTELEAEWSQNVHHLRQHLELLQNIIPAPRSEQDEKQKLIADVMTQRRVEAALEKEAYTLWNQRPIEGRMKRTGWFRLTEDVERRDKFIQSYKEKHFENRLKQAFGINIRI